MGLLGRIGCLTALVYVISVGIPAWAQEHEPAPPDEHGVGAPAGEHEPGTQGGHGEANAHGGHGERAPINWVSLDYGHGTRKDGTPYKFASPPLLAALINFALLIFLLVRFAKKPLVSYLESRGAMVEKALEEAAQLRDEARAKLEQIDAKLRDLDAEVARIKADVAKDAEEEKQRIIKAASAEADRLIAMAEQTLQREIRKARHLLETEAVEGAVKAARVLVKEKINEADRRRLNEEYIKNLAASGGAK